MASAKWIIGAFGPAGETGETIFLPDGAHAIAPIGQYFVGVALMSHVPNQLVVGGVENRMQGHGQFHHAQPGTKVPAGLRNTINHLGAHFISQLAQLLLAEITHVTWLFDGVEQRCLWLGTQIISFRFTQKDRPAVQGAGKPWKMKDHVGPLPRACANTLRC